MTGETTAQTTAADAVHNPQRGLVSCGRCHAHVTSVLYPGELELDVPPIPGAR